MTLKSCPFCGAKASDKEYANRLYYDDPMLIDHKAGCWLGKCTCIYRGDRPSIAAWNKRTPDWEQRYGELVETVAKRTDQAKEKGEKQ